MIILSLRVFDCLLRIWGRILQHYPFILTNFFRLETFSDSESFGGGILNLEVGERWRCFLQPLTILTLTPIETSDPPGMTRLKTGGNLTPQNDIPYGFQGGHQFRNTTVVERHQGSNSGCWQAYPEFTGEYLGSTPHPVTVANEGL